jgi:hypothetical protein
MTLIKEYRFVTLIIAWLRIGLRATPRKDLGIKLTMHGKKILLLGQGFCQSKLCFRKEEKT